MNTNTANTTMWTMPNRMLVRPVPKVSMLNMNVSSRISMVGLGERAVAMLPVPGMAAPNRPAGGDGERPKAPDCFACRHFRITHEPAHPYGCRAFGFVGRELPATAVRANSGRECEAFEPKPPRSTA